jgi:hypothetical protein
VITIVANERARSGKSESVIRGCVGSMVPTTADYSFEANIFGMKILDQ